MTKRWTEGHVHVAMRHILKARGWSLVAGEYPGGSDHELYPLNVVDPEVARDDSPDPRRHSLGELIPDLVALKGRQLLIAEAKPLYNEPDREKLTRLITARRVDLHSALRKFARERNRPELLPLESLVLCPTLVFAAGGSAPVAPKGFSYLRVRTREDGFFEGFLSEVVS